MQKMAEDHRADLTNLQAKMKLLQRHQVFEAEILAHGKIIASVLQVRGDSRLEMKIKWLLLFVLFRFTLTLCSISRITHVLYCLVLQQCSFYLYTYLSIYLHL